MKKLNLYYILATLIVFLAALGAQADYLMVDLGGGTDAKALSINNSGDIVGTLGYSALLWHNYSPTYLPTVLGQSFSAANSISNNGLVAGHYQDAAHYEHACVWDPAMDALTELAIGGTSVAYHVNDSGQVAGQGNVPLGYRQPVTWLGSGITQLPLLSGGTWAVANSINESGTVAGFGDGGVFNSMRAIVWQSGVANRIDTRDWGQSAAMDINNNGFVVGYMEDVSSNEHVMSYDGTMHDLGKQDQYTSSWALAVNNYGIIVGYSQGGSPIDYHPWALVNSEFIDLPLLPGWVSGQALDINDGGQIVGVATDGNGVQHAVTWTQTPEPSPVIALVGGFSAVGFWMKRRRR